jgi:hypothetical protein
MKRIPVFLQTNRPVEKEQLHHFNSKKLGFVIVRSVRDRQTGFYWLEAIRCIRRLHPDVPVVVIDDNSDPRFVRNDLKPKNCLIVMSEFPGCGEMLGYYYYWRHKWFETAVVIHDSVFIQEKIDYVAECKGGVRFIWHIETKVFDDVPLEEAYLKKTANQYSALYEEKDMWKGCFGVMAVVRHDFLEKIRIFFDLVPHVSNRRQRSAMERVFAVICFYHNPLLLQDPSVMGDIHGYPHGWGYTFSNYQKEKGWRPMPAIVKVWTGR